MEQGDLAVFYIEGSDPALGLPAESVIVSPDGTTLTGSVPAWARPGTPYFISVRPGLNMASRFNDLAFLVTGGPVLEPIIVPNQGVPGSQFTIYDPQGRIQQGDLVIFYLEGTDPMLGNSAQNVVVSEDGKTMTGFVPGATQRQTQQYVSVRPTLDAISRFNDLAFYVT